MQDVVCDAGQASMSIIEDFDPDFASPFEWAQVYRACGFQVVPAGSPADSKTDDFKFPIVKWRQHEKELVDDAQFNTWYGAGGKFHSRVNMGVVTGSCSGHLFVVDLDTHKNPDAAVWWQGIHDDHTGGILPECPTQTTGGGGKQYFFRAPVGWRAPTGKNSKLGVDIRGEGGFAMLPPSLHQSGKNYQWDEGCAPWEVDPPVADEWLCREIEAVMGLAEGAGIFDVNAPVDPSTPQKAREVVGSTGQTHNAFGAIIDGREEYMTKMIWGCVLDLYRDSPIAPPESRQNEIVASLFRQYEIAVKSRIFEPGTPNHILLEREGRGVTLFVQKWRAAMLQWDGKVARDAAAPRDRKEPTPTQAPGPFSVTDAIADFTQDPDFFEVLSVEDIYNLPDPEYLIKDLMISEGLFFLYGAPGCGKSFIALSMALSIAAQFEKWWGRKIERTGPVIYISSEGVSDMKYRIQAWASRNGLDAKKLPFRMIRQTINFMSEADITKLLRTVRRVSEKLGQNPALVVVDTVSRVLPGADENLQKDMTLFIRGCDIVRTTFNTAVMGVHHTSRNGGAMRGSTVFDGAGDGIFYVGREEGSMEGVFAAKKIKSAPDGWSWTFGLTVIPLVGHTSLYAEKVSDVAMPMPDTSPEDDFGGRQETGFMKVGKKQYPAAMCFRILDLVVEAAGRNEYWSAGVKAREHGRYAPDKIRHHFKQLSEDDAKAFIQDWLTAEILENYEYDKRNKKWGLVIKNRPAGYNVKSSS